MDGGIHYEVNYKMVLGGYETKKKENWNRKVRERKRDALSLIIKKT